MWQFQAVAADGSLVPLDERQRGRIADYEQALAAACASEVANPIFSGFRVRSSMGDCGRIKAPGGNEEYGFCQALHSEESAGAAYRSRCNGATGRPVFGLAARESRQIPTPCGNCRDYLL